MILTQRVDNIAYRLKSPLPARRETQVVLTFNYYNIIPQNYLYFDFISCCYIWYKIVRITRGGYIGCKNMS